jgi:hypothetical protein
MIKHGLTLIITGVVSFAALAAPYSPAVRDTFPDNVYWGDTHLHTFLSGDAYSMGNSVTPDEAYRFARGETVRATGGEDVRLQRPLDFLMVADHAENIGVLPRLVAGDAKLMASPHGEYFADMLKTRLSLPEVLSSADQEEFNRTGGVLMAAKGAWKGDYAIDKTMAREIWNEVIDVAEKYNDPGNFTTFAGYEYSSAAFGMLHRNVLFAGGPEQTRQTMPFSHFDSYDPEDLWAHLEEYQTRVGSDVMSIPHNSNLSVGQMFNPLTFKNKPIDARYARTRAAIEPLLEVTQIKGDSETHPFISPDDEFADYESFGKVPAAPQEVGKAASKNTAKGAGKKTAKGTGKTAAKGTSKTAKAAGKKPPTKKGATTEAGPNPVTDPTDYMNQSYARSALKLGLSHQAKLGTNPFKFGMIGSTDSHTGLATADEDNFWGKMGTNEPSPFRAYTMGMFGSAGYAAVWARENTREAIFAALKRKEVYGSTGPRITVRFFGGWGYTDDDAESPTLAAIGYAGGVPMGSDLSAAPGRGAPSFLIRAAKDPEHANLDRVQVIKGWRDKRGKLHEKVYDVAWSGEREIGKDGKLPSVGSTVDLATASYTNAIGTAELSVNWRDPDFNRKEAAFYYVRVIQIPTPRWNTYDAAFYGLKDLPSSPPSVIEERAYSSPIWYTP